MDHREWLFLVGLLPTIFLPIVWALVVSGKYWKAAEERERARRLGEHRMNARLLRLDI